MTQTTDKQAAHTAPITRLSHDGRGIATIDGKTVFLQGGLPNETVLFQYTRKHPTFDEGVVSTVLQPADTRVTPRCQHFTICGGCQLQHLHNETQLLHKQTVLLEFLKYQAGITPKEILPPIQSPPWGYRRKARLSIKFVAKKNKVLVGFREKNGAFVADITHCDILSEKIGFLLPDFSRLFYELTIREHIPQMEVAITEQETAIIIRHLAPLTQTDLEKITQFSRTHQLKCYLQPAGPQSVYLFYPTDSSPLLSYHLKQYNLQLRFLPQQFIQINDSVNQAMIQQALYLLDLQPTDQVLDLFCGIGNFSLPIAKHCAWVMGIEGDLAAVNQAKDNAIYNKISNSEFFCIDLSRNPRQYLNPVLHDKLFNKIILDPPRDGAKILMPWIVEKQKAEKQPSHIVYISCHPATLARDANDLIQAGYILEKAGVLDMFPHTAHVETMALFIKR